MHAGKSISTKKANIERYDIERIGLAEKIVEQKHYVLYNMDQAHEERAKETALESAPPTEAEMYALRQQLKAAQEQMARLRADLKEREWRDLQEASRAAARS